MVLLFWWQIVLLFHKNIAPHATMVFDVTIAQTDITIAVPRQLATGSIHDYLVFSSWCYTRYENWMECSIWFEADWKVILYFIFISIFNVITRLLLLDGDYKRPLNILTMKYGIFSLTFHFFVQRYKDEQRTISYKLCYSDLYLLII